MQKLFYIINSIIATLLIFAYLSPFIDPQVTWFFSIFGLFYPLILILNLAFVFIWLVVKPEKSLLSLSIILLGWFPIQRMVGFNSQTISSSDISLLSYNIGKTRINFNRDDKDVHIDAFTKFINQQDVDILCIQERLKKHLPIYDKIFSQYNVYPENELGTAIYSKFPIVRGGNIPFETVAHNATWADLKIHDDTIRVFSIHLSSNRITKLTGEMLENPNLQNKEIWEDAKFVLSKYHHHAKIRSQQIDQVLKEVDKSPHPVILMGDFNDVPQSHIYKKLKERFCDAFVQAGRGIEQTYISIMPALRIDYAFIDKSININSHKTINTRLSDHYPILTTIDLSN